MNSELLFQTKWTLWFHGANDDNWDENSYTKLGDIENVGEFWTLYKLINDFTAGIFFIMKENIFPRWEDINNLSGGYWTFRVHKNIANDTWKYLCADLLSQELVNNDSFDEINGISISPKVGNCILKIWNTDSNNNDSNCLNFHELSVLSKDNSFYKAHRDQNNLQI